MNLPLPNLGHDIEWRHARTWVGRQLVLRKPWLDYPAGTPCRVMCVVDFGDGPLFWITTDDADTRDVDQVTRRELETHFLVPEGGAFHPSPRRPRRRPGRPGLGMRPEHAAAGES